MVASRSSLSPLLTESTKRRPGKEKPGLVDEFALMSEAKSGEGDGVHGCAIATPKQRMNVSTKIFDMST